MTAVLDPPYAVIWNQEFPLGVEIEPRKNDGSHG
jgi:hypothetical protein